MPVTLPPLLWPTLIYALILGLHLLLPGRWVDGYVRDPHTGAPLRYRLGGLRVLLATVGLWVAAGLSGRMPWDALHTHRWSVAAGACVVGLLVSLALVLPAPARRGLLADLYLGRLENPRLGGGRVDAKMALYLLGAVMLELNLLAFAAHHLLAHAHDPSPGVVLYTALFSFFVLDYLFFEHVHLYTYDLFAERVGLKLTWGCLFFYPTFYPVGVWWAADRQNPHAPAALLVLAAVVFFGGWVLARGANMQKHAFKRDPHRPFLGLMRPRTLSDGEHALLCSGFWGVSRHVNYLGEILMATGLTLALGFPSAPWPWLYPLYYVALLVPRQHFDDLRCARKYGGLWEAYRREVPWRIVPRVY